MNKEEAIEVLNTYDTFFYGYTAEEVVDAIDIAIEALQQERPEASEPHGRLIDVDKVFNALRISKDIDDKSKSKFMGLLLESPTVIEAEEQENE